MVLLLFLHKTNDLPMQKLFSNLWMNKLFACVAQIMDLNLRNVSISVTVFILMIKLKMACLKGWKRKRRIQNVWSLARETLVQTPQLKSTSTARLTRTPQRSPRLCATSWWTWLTYERWRWRLLGLLRKLLRWGTFKAFNLSW